jgi:hypothetical protein
MRSGQRFFRNQPTSSIAVTGSLAFLTALLVSTLAWAGPADPCAENPGDTDSDTVCDALDTCINISNAGGCDTDSDGYGNRCDGDFDNNGQVNSTDFTEYFIPSFIAAADLGFGTDMDCNGQSNSSDFSTYFIPQFIGALPGPSGLSCAGTVPCP